MALIKLKKSSTAAAAPTSAVMDYGELAINYADGILYYKDSSNVIKQIGSNATVAGAVLLTGTQTITGAKTFNSTLTLAPAASLTASQPAIDITQTWGNGAITFTGLKQNITNNGSAVGSLLMDLQVGGSSKFRVDSAGSLQLNGTQNTFGTAIIDFSNSSGFATAYQVSGISGETTNSGAGSIIGINVNAATSFAGTVASLTSVMGNVRTLNASTVVTNSHMFYAQSPLITQGSIANQYGLYIETQKPAGVSVTAGYGVYQLGATDINYFAGNVGIGNTAPGEKLQVAGSIKATTGDLILDNNRTVFWGGSTEGITGSQSANSLSLLTSGSTRVFIKSDGNVGIGTTSPGMSLEINSVNQLRLKQSDASGAYFDFISTSSSHGAGLGKFVITRNGGTTSTPPFAIDTTSNVGIGTAAPLTRLDVAGSGRFTGSASSTLTGTADPTASTTLVGTGTLFTTELVIGDRITINAETRTVTAIASATSLTVDTAFTDTASASITKLSAILLARLSSNAVGMVMNNLGNVGIGTAAPAYNLHILGTGTIASPTTLSINAPDFTTGGDSRILLSQNTSLGDFQLLYAGTDGSPRSDSRTSNNAYIEQSQAINIRTKNNGSAFNSEVLVGGGIFFSTNATGSLAAERMRIDTSGNVGIGTTSPTSKLKILGAPSAPSLVSNAAAIFELGSSAGTSLVFTNDSSTPYATSIQNRNSGGSNLSFPIALNPLGGNVGIGNTSPAYTLDVTGTGRFTSTLAVTGATTLSSTLSAGASTLYASGATNSSTSTSTNWLRSPAGTVTAFIGDTDSTSAYGVNAFSGNLRFNGDGINWGDFGYYPTGGSYGPTNWGHFRFSLAGNFVVTTPDAWVSAGVFIAATGFRVSNSAQTAANYLRSNGTNFISANLAAADLTGTVATARIAGSYTGITAVGTLTTLAVTGATTLSSTLAVTGAVDVTGTLSALNTLSIGSVLKQRGVTQFNNSPLTTGTSTVTRSVTQDQTIAAGTNVLYFGYPTVTNIQVNVPSANYTTVTLSRSTLSAVTTGTGNITFAKFIGSVSVSQAVASKTLNFGTGTSGTSGTPGVGTTALTIPLAAGQSLDATTPITGTNVPASTTITTALNSVGVIVMSADSTSTFITTTSGPITFGTPIVAAVSISQTGIATTLIFASSAISALYVGMYVSGTGISVAANNNTSGIAAGAYVYATGTSALVTNNVILADTIVLSVTSQNVTLSSRTSGLVTTGGGAITFITNFGTLFSAPVTANQTVTNTTRLSTAVVASSVNSSGQYIIEYVISASVASPVWSLLDYPTNTAVSGSGILAGSYAIAPASHTLISGTLYYARLTLNNALTADITVGSTLIFSTYQFNTLTFASATGLFQGAIVTGNNIPPNASIFSISSSTVTLSFDGGSTSTTSPLMGLAPTTTSGVITFATISMLGHTTISASVAETGTALVTDSTFLYGNPVSLYNNLNLLQRALGSKLLLSDVTGLVNGTVISNHANIAAGTTISFISTSGPGLGVTLSTPLLGTVPVSSVIWFGGSGVNNKTVRAEWPLNPIDQTDNRIIYLNNTDGLMVGTLMYGYTNGSYTGIVFNTNSDTTSAALNSSIWITAVVDHYSITLNVAPALGVTAVGWASTSVVGTTVTAVTLTSGSIISYQPRVAVTASIDINTVVPAGTTVTLLLSLTSSKNGTNGIYVNSRVFGTNIPYGTIVTSIIPNKSIVLSSPTPLSSTLDSSVVLTFTTATVAVERIDVSIARNSISWSPTSTNVYRYNSASVLASASSNDSGFVNRITTVWSNAYASAADRAIAPGFGGFTIALQSRPSHSYACYMKACIPIGYTVNFTGNSIGNLSTTTFVTDVIGTGRWEDYVVYLKTSSPSTTFSTTFYMFLVSSSAGSSTAGGWNPTPMSPLIWHVSSVQAYEMDNRRAKVTGSFGVTALTGSGNTGYIPRLSGSTTVLTNSPLLVNAANIASTLPIAVSSIGGASGGTLTVTTPLTLSSSLTVTGSGVNIGPISGASSGTNQLAIHSPHTGGFNNNSGYLMRADIKFGFEYTSIYGSNVFPSLFHSHITSTASSSGTVAILCGITRMLTTAAGSGVYVTPSLFVGEANNSSYTRVYTATANATASSTVAFSSIVAPPVGSLINGVGITAGTTVTASSTTSVTLSAAHTGITASPYVISYALILTASAGASSQAVITFTAALGMPIYAGAHITGTGISAGTYILTTAQSISTTVTLSTNLTATASGTYTIVHARVFTGTAPTGTGIAGNIDWVSFIFGTTAGSVGTILHHGSPIFGTGIPPGTTLERSSDTTASSATIALTQKLTAAVTASTYVIINMLPAASITSAGAISGTSLVVSGGTTINSSLTVAGTVGNLGRYTTFSAGGVQTNSFNDNSAAVFPFVARNSQPGLNYGTGYGFTLGYGGTQNVDGTSVAAGDIAVAQETAYTSTLSTQDSYMRFSTSLDGTVAEKMRITSAGNVGIGTTSPTYKLDISGGQNAYRFTSSTHLDSYINAAAAATQAFTIYQQNTADVFRLGFTTAALGEIKAANNKNFHFADTAGNEWLYLKDGGNVGIGTTTPSGKLEVAGTIIGSSTVQGTRLISTIATGTAPLTVTSTTAVTNLNADLLDGQEGTYYQNATNLNAGTVATARIAGSYTGITAVGTLTTLAVTGAATFSSAAPQISLTNATSNWIAWGSQAAAPTFTTRSAGTKLLLYDTLSASALDYAIGVSSNTVWMSAQNTNSSFAWYAGSTTSSMTFTSGILNTASGYNVAGTVFCDASRNLTTGTINGQTISSAASFTGTVNVVTGIKINGAATAANYLRGDGTNFISAALAAADLTGTIVAARLPAFTGDVTSTAGTVALAISGSYTASLRAGYTLSGGGTITYNASSYLLWSTRIIVISNGYGSHFSTSGYFDITCPTSGTTITDVGGVVGGPITATSAGIPIGNWYALYYILPIGNSSASVSANFRIVGFSSALVIPEYWVLLAVQNNEGVYIKLFNAQSLKAGQVYDTTLGTTSATNLNAGTVATARLGSGTASATTFLRGDNTWAAPVGTVPVGTVLSWLKSFNSSAAGNLPATGEFVECNGQVLSTSPYTAGNCVYFSSNGTTPTIPNLNGATVNSVVGTKRFLRGSAASGGTGGSESQSHTHSITSASTSICVSGVGITFVTSVTSPTGSTSVDTLPPYYEVVWIMRVM